MAHACRIALSLDPPAAPGHRELIQTDRRSLALFSQSTTQAHSSALPGLQNLYGWRLDQTMFFEVRHLQSPPLWCQLKLLLPRHSRQRLSGLAVFRNEGRPRRLIRALQSGALGFCSRAA